MSYWQFHLTRHSTENMLVHLIDRLVREQSNFGPKPYVERISGFSIVTIEIDIPILTIALYVKKEAFHDNYVMYCLNFRLSMKKN